MRPVRPGLSRSYASEGVNTVLPAFIATSMTVAMMIKSAEQNGSSFDEAVASFLQEERLELPRRRRILGHHLIAARSIPEATDNQAATFHC